MFFRFFFFTEIFQYKFIVWIPFEIENAAVYHSLEALLISFVISVENYLQINIKISEPYNF